MVLSRQRSPDIVQTWKFSAKVLSLDGALGGRHWKLHFNNPPQILLPETLIPPQITNPQILIRRDSLSPRRRGSKKSHPTALTPPSSSSKKNPSGPPKQTKPRAPPLFPTKSPTLTTLKRAMLETVQRVRLVLHQKEESMQEECTRPQRARVP
ncbi:mannose-1-phosphate guanyltransferase alpha [Striga asiatica]|uniref:Mannose-1-phosphate guanyltransferase alpha n=1 Tax=Striga asiatica TaxID=4170 RepID=A0A5A7R5C2_STRAF|nr:mannose-1-phosphate guanyltransferase alpha [Striga asiatica]